MDESGLFAVSLLSLLCAGLLAAAFAALALSSWQLGSLETRMMALDAARSAATAVVPQSLMSGIPALAPMEARTLANNVVAADAAACGLGASTLSVAVMQSGNTDAITRYTFPTVGVAVGLVTAMGPLTFSAHTDATADWVP